MPTTLFPPIVDSYQSVFIKGEDCRIYFAFSQFNTDADIRKEIIVTFVNINTNKTLFKDTFLYAMALYPWEKDEKGYFITIPLTDLVDDALALNQYYKAQLRFIDKSVTESGNALYTLTADKMSEWSSATLIRNISKPKLGILNFTDDNYVNDHYQVNNFFQIEGLFSFEDSIEQDRLNSYRIIISDEYNTIVEDSGIVYTDFSIGASNHFVYKTKHAFKPLSSYIVQISYSTVNGYDNYQDYNITIIKHALEYTFGEITVEPDDENGLIILNVSISAKTSKDSSGTFYIRRASYKDNFNEYETLNEVKVKFLQDSGFYSFTDITAESGVLYKYSVQYVDDNASEENMYIIPIYSELVMLNTEHIYLADKDAYFKVSYNPSVSNYKEVVMESVTNTLGGKYPIVRRNGDTKYKQFNLSGLISFLADDGDSWPLVNGYDDSLKRDGIKQNYQSSLFLSREEAYKTAVSAYNKYNLDNKISDYNDFIFEKMFRDKAMKFLYNNSVKLFKSATEGNMLVKLTNISLTPNVQLGRRIYSFTATVNEIADCTIENLFKYGILKPFSNEYIYLYILETVKENYNPYKDMAYINSNKIYELLTQEQKDDLWSLILNERKYLV